MAWEGYRDVIHTRTNGIRKAKVQMELNLTRDVKNNRKWFYRYTDLKSKAKGNVPLENWLPQIWRRLRYSSG